MSLHASWVHGNAMTVESPENFRRVGHFGWGADVSPVPGKASWLHVPLPTPVITGDVRTSVQRFFLLFNAEGCEIRNVHVYDGSGKVQELNGLSLRGEHRTGLDASNTFDLSAPHSVVFGMGLTFFLQSDIGFDTNIDTRFILATAGGDFLA
ncbi:DUF6623 family protein [Cellulomonas sp. URHE0023]|uniref:DUF6623 family protein n=1 Tax=Cellulomonas sp. URHE0023 TaxID=1380354 RepID=UPI0004849F16|nr:DUF6623 family protein [Cellulomonas sp. URHE0023]